MRSGDGIVLTTSAITPGTKWGYKFNRMVSGSNLLTLLGSVVITNKEHYF